MPDEASALASLVLGARVRAGEHSRSFGYLNDDPLGSPRASQSAPPTLAQKYRRFVAPCATGTRVLRDLSILPLILELSASQCIALLRAARLYQDALWVVESEPELAWLMLVSALETGALSWHQEELTPVEILETSKSEFAAQLSEKGDGILSLVAEEVAPLFKATAKFQKFCLHFLPDEPSERPYPYLQVKWSKTGWKSILSKVYDYRSRALHSGIPFPKPMCEPPEVHEPNLAFSEKGTGALAVQTLGAKWEANDLPVSLNTFAQLVQKILLSWWRDMAAGNTATTSR